MTKHCCALLLLSSLLTTALFAEGSATVVQEKPVSTLVSPNLLGPLVGYYSGSVEFSLNSHMSLLIEPGYWNIRSVPIFGATVSSGTELWFGYLKAGPVLYAKEVFRDWYFNPYLKGSLVTAADSGSSVTTQSYGGGGQAGYRWTWDWFSMAVGGLAEYNHTATAVSFGSTTGGFGTSVEGFATGLFLTFALAFH